MLKPPTYTILSPIPKRSSLGNARFTVLTPQLIRMEWAADGKFEDHASLVFLNRKLPVPKFTSAIKEDGQAQHDDHHRRIAIDL